MAQFDACLPVRPVPHGVVYFVVLQNDLFDDLRTTVVAPLRRSDPGAKIGRLFPMLSVNGDIFTLSTTEVVSLPTKALGPAVANLSADRERIVAALDMLFTGI
jgi:toxin CcdB